MQNEGDLGYQMSFLIRSGADAARLFPVLREQFEVDEFETDRLDTLEQLLALWDTEKSSSWLDDLSEVLSDIEEILNETTVEHEFAHRCQSVIEALGFAAERLCGSEVERSESHVPSDN